MQLYYKDSVCSLAIRIILHELKLPCIFEAVNLKTKQTQSGENYLTINPKGAVPALVLDNKNILTENAVILQYLADKHPSHNLLAPIGDFNRYRTLEWLNFISMDLHRYCSPLFWSRVPDSVKQELYWPILKQKLSIVENHLENNTFLMGSSFTISDCYLIVIIIWLFMLKADMKQWPNILRYYEHIKQRPCVLLALDEESLSDY